MICLCLYVGYDYNHCGGFWLLIIDRQKKMCNAILAISEKIELRGGDTEYYSKIINTFFVSKKTLIINFS